MPDTVTVGVDVDKNGLYGVLEPDDAHANEARYACRYVATLRCGCIYSEESICGYGETHAEAIADLQRQLL